MKIPRARTQEEKNGIRRAQEQLGHPRRSGSFSSSSRTAAAAGKKRTADDQGDSVNKKPKNGADKAIAATKPRADHQRPYVPKKPDIGASTSRSLKRHSDDQSSSSPKRSKGGSFMDYLPKNDSKAATTGESKGEPKAPSSVTNHTEGGQGGAATESRKIKPAVSNAKRSADKKNATGTSSKPLTGANKSGIAGDGEAGEQEVGGTQESLTNAVANATTRADKEATTGELPKPQSETEPPNASLATANPVDHAGPGEQDSKPGRVDTPAQESSAARSKDSDPGAKDEPKPDHLPLEGSASMASGAALADGEVAASALSDGNKTSKNVTGSDSTITSPGNKRKRDSEITSPAKKSKVRHSNPRNSVGNYRQGCFINASAHALHSVPALASLRNETSDAIAADNILSDAETKLAGTGGRSRTKEELRAKLRDHLRSKADRNEL